MKRQKDLIISMQNAVKLIPVKRSGTLETLIQFTEMEIELWFT